MFSWRAFLSAVLLALLPTSAAFAHLTKYTAILSGPAEASPNNSPGLGTALVTLDLDEITMRIESSFSDLLGAVTTANIHAVTATPLTGTAIVATPLPDFPLDETFGTYDRTINLAEASSYDPAFLTAHGPLLVDALNALIFGLDSREAYLSIRTTAFPEGEIRGFLINLPGDFNHNLVVDAADYVVWRDLLGQTGEGLDADTNNDNVIDDADYAVWKQNFGRAGLVAGSGTSLLAGVPEPSAFVLLAAGCALVATRRYRAPAIQF